ncbi:hypothetical protein [Photobacterium lutimaris]|uniref:Lipoprotein n=1 Tax=Photobacterium lutimaris TaxID=388278 RepID=A0A2T3IQD4_9GAMM|nr:hypothetical protein [Photobacterium lutimaris]PSU30546.1 hypothetical protein C9I99_23575 [Photobacterium lutimaris]TDR76114.1 hypothetical protein DFP78_103106 [Photobacterium lutimaris]
MKRILNVALLVIVSGCASDPVTTTQVPEQLCVGSTVISAELSDKFELVRDPALLSQALGEALAGKLCQGAVYQSTQEVTIYRAWNSTNPHSQFGQWWSFTRPAGQVSEYRKDYEICYQWSPLDKLAECTLKPGTKVVVGNGQSAWCSEYLSYPVSDKQQVYITDASDSAMKCQSYDGVISWEHDVAQ